MPNILTAALIGLVAGIIDVIPMILQKLGKRDTISAFIHYFALGLVIPFVHWDMAPWYKGMVIALITAIPVMVIVYPRNKKAIVPMILFNLMLGAAIGLAGAMFIG